MSVAIIEADLLRKLIPYADHTAKCDAAQPMWHKGPCDCGFRQVVLELQSAGIEIHDTDPPNADENERVERRRCENEKCRNILPINWQAVYCSNDCAREDA